MTSKEIIRRVITFDAPPRMGLTFNAPYFSDIRWISAGKLVNRTFDVYAEWGRHPELLSSVPDFEGEVRADSFGNIYGRLEGKTKGECIKGALQDGWELADCLELPVLEDDEAPPPSDAFSICGSVSIFSTLRDIRRIDSALTDTILEPERVAAFLERVKTLSLTMVRAAAKCGADGIQMADDWGTQIATLISPAVFRKLFKPVYRAIAEEIHRNGMLFLLHSCGCIDAFIEDLIDAGIDVLQLDQPELMGVEYLGKTYGGRVSFWCPVDIQKIMATGNRTLIEDGARRMTDALYRGGGFIAKDYSAWQDIDVADEWAGWARDVFLKRADML